MDDLAKKFGEKIYNAASEIVNAEGMNELSHIIILADSERQTLFRATKFSDFLPVKTESGSAPKLLIDALDGLDKHSKGTLLVLTIETAGTIISSLKNLIDEIKPVKDEAIAAYYELYPEEK